MARFAESTASANGMRTRHLRMARTRAEPVGLRVGRSVRESSVGGRLARASPANRPARDGLLSPTHSEAPTLQSWCRFSAPHSPASVRLLREGNLSVSVPGSLSEFRPGEEGAPISRPRRSSTSVELRTGASFGKQRTRVAVNPASYEATVPPQGGSECSRQSSPQGPDAAVEQASLPHLRQRPCGGNSAEVEPVEQCRLALTAGRCAEVSAPE